MLKIGLDWGKTNIRIAASNDVGRIVHFQKTSSQAIPKTWKSFMIALQAMVGEFLHSENIQSKDISQISAGVAGVRTHFQPRYDVKIYDISAIIDNDVVMLSKTIPIHSEVLLYAGTGAISVFREANDITIYGGEGQVLGDPGSGFHLGQSIVRTELRKLALSKKVTPALQKIFTTTNTQSTQELLAMISNIENPVQKIAEFVKIVGWELIDQNCIEEIVQSWEEVVQKLNRKTIILAGGIFSSNSRVITSLTKRCPLQEFYLLDTEPSHLFATFNHEENKQITPSTNFLVKIDA